MKLKALDQIHVSAVKADSLRPNEEFEVSDAMGDELLKNHPTKFARTGKSMPAPSNKAETPPPNKVIGGAKTKGK